ESTLVTLADGSESMGIVASETANEIVLNVPGGSPVKYPRTKIQHTSKSEQSLMPALAGSMTEQELVDLVEYLSSLKK
ncbi:MAG TPA: hypothetical protein VFD46_06390, partial [Chryseolinea sp.]|nr:hypothetical protein [Chryseolinea sp.]